jgi:hypothetical protein
VEDYLKKFPAYPVKEGRFLDSYSVDGDIPLNHPGLLAMVVPGDEVDIDHPLRQVALDTLKNFFSITNRKGFKGRKSVCDDLSWSWLVCMAVKLGEPELADRILFDLGVSEFLKPNGMFSINPGGRFDSVEEKREHLRHETLPHDILYWSAANCYGKRRQLSFIESSSCLVYMVNEMMLQSQNGIIRLFPALPKRIKKCAFRTLRAQGGFIVSALKDTAGVKTATIHSTVGGKCRVKFPAGATSDIYWGVSSGLLKRTGLEDRILEFDTESGKSYILSRDEKIEEIELGLIPSKEAVKCYKDRYGKICTIGWKGNLSG